MMKRRTYLIAAAVAISAALAGVYLFLNTQAAKRSEEMGQLNVISDGRQDFMALPRTVPHDPAAARVGAPLFHHHYLVRNKWLTCGRCHPNFAGAPLPDGTGTARGTNKNPGYASRTVFNVGFADRFMRDASLTNLRDVVRLMITGSEYGAAEVDKTEQRLSGDVEFAKPFCAVYKDGVKLENLVDAMVNFLRTRSTPMTRFDQWCNGNEEALTAQERAGAKDFRANCLKCHSGPTLGGRSSHKGRKVPQLRGFERLKLQLPPGHPEPSEDLLAFLKTL